jgi:hypothetical protein
MRPKKALIVKEQITREIYYEMPINGTRAIMSISHANCALSLATTKDFHYLSLAIDFINNVISLE